MANRTLTYECNRPIKVSILGAKGTGKTSIALQYVVGQYVDSPPTTVIEDVYRKRNEMLLTEPRTTEYLCEKWGMKNSNKTKWLSRLSQSSPVVQPEVKASGIKVKFGLEVTDTAGYCKTSTLRPTQRSFFNKISFRRKHHVSCTKQRLGEPPRDQVRSSLGVASQTARHDACLSNSDAVIIVYDVTDEKTLSVACDVRERLVRCRRTECRRRTSCFKQIRKCFCFGGEKHSDVERRNDLPPVFLVGTHSDSRQVDKSQFFDMKCSRDHGTLLARSVSEATMPKRSLTAHDVYHVIKEWSECVGFAEVTSRDNDVVEQIFHQLNLAVITSSPAERWIKTV
ncbi:uncharacterized protein LOC113475749 [Ciona intestinalis]